jgi:hypothetical protein
MYLLFTFLIKTYINLIIQNLSENKKFSDLIQVYRAFRHLLKHLLKS